MSLSQGPITDPYEGIGVTLNPDGSITRAAEAPKTPASDDPNNEVLSKDLPLNPTTNTSVRLFLPQKSLSATAKLPVIIYIHGGGFVILNASSTSFHDFCSLIAIETPALVVSIEYRLAPEHRLPAAYEDCMDAIHWIKTTTESDWVTKYADLSNCFIMGTSAGANAAYNICLRADDVKPLKINGLILHQPFFGGVERTASETRLANAKVLPLCVSDLMWELSLPLGFGRDHEYCNVVKGFKEENFDVIRKQGLKVTVTGCDGDLLIDRQVEFVKVLKEKGVDIVGKFVEGEYHGYDFFELSKSGHILDAIKEIINSTNSI
ncbi:hypothetical protein ACJIZ3_005031 [Penstemon smallii]|uniref:Alpha/beta hydrolase fold-3 domain-containing protein n=1 Tax=Penstemon smallii TaxID=265156 RepID=A0ABD3S3Q5_9LAMI